MFCVWQEADFFYVPVYAACMIEAVAGWADAPWWNVYRWVPPAVWKDEELGSQCVVFYRKKRCTASLTAIAAVMLCEALLLSESVAQPTGCCCC